MKKVTMILRNVPEQVRRDLKIKAAEAGVSMQALALRAIKNFINKGVGNHEKN